MVRNFVEKLKASLLAPAFNPHVSYDRKGSAPRPTAPHPAFRPPYPYSELFFSHLDVPQSHNALSTGGEFVGQNMGQSTGQIVEAHP